MPRWIDEPFFPPFTHFAMLFVYIFLKEYRGSEAKKASTPSLSLVQSLSVRTYPSWKGTLRWLIELWWDLWQRKKKRGERVFFLFPCLRLQLAAFFSRNKYVVHTAIDSASRRTECNVQYFFSPFLSALSYSWGRTLMLKKLQKLLCSRYICELKNKKNREI